MAQKSNQTRCLKKIKSTSRNFCATLYKAGSLPTTEILIAINFLHAVDKIRYCIFVVTIAHCQPTDNHHIQHCYHLPIGLTLWPWSWTFTVQHTICVKCEYFMNQEEQHEEIHDILWRNKRRWWQKIVQGCTFCMFLLISVGYYCYAYLFVLLCYVCSVLLLWLTLTEVFPCFFLSCKANARVYYAKTGHGPHYS